MTPMERTQRSEEARWLEGDHPWVEQERKAEFEAQSSDDAGKALFAVGHDVRLWDRLAEGTREAFRETARLRQEDQ